jgi:hypothetical protein
VKPPQLTALAYSRLELTHEHSFYVNATERPYYKVVKVGDVTLPNGGSGWKPNFFYTAKSNTFNPPYGWVIRFNPAVLGVNGILAGTTYQLALWFNSNPGVVFVRNFTPVGDAGITPINLTPVIPDPDPEEPDEPTDPGGGEEAGSGDGPGMGGVVETTIIASNRNVMNLAVSWVTVSGVQRAKITDNSTYSTPGGQHRGIHLDGGEWLIDDTSWQNETYPPRTAYPSSASSHPIRAIAIPPLPPKPRLTFQLAMRLKLSKQCPDLQFRVILFPPGGKFVE